MNFRSRIAYFVSTFCYIGLIPFIPGTFGSLAGVGLFLLVKNHIAWHLGLIFLLGLLGFWSAHETEINLGKKDPRYVVIDEVVGMLIALIGIPYSLFNAICAFLFFRLLDTFKAYPAGKLQDLHGGIGIMSDDIIAGLYANLTLQFTLRLISLATS